VLEFNKIDLVPCHNDLWVNNILRDIDGLKFIDFELSGNNDPRFELGNFWQESGLGKNYLSEITTKYFGKKDEKNELIAEAYGIAAAYTWSLVGIILLNESSIEYDYKKFSEDKLMFVKENLTPQFIKNINKLSTYKKWNHYSFLKSVPINPI
jgi:thiamine kinase-like enzyme